MQVLFFSHKNDSIKIEHNLGNRSLSYFVIFGWKFTQASLVIHNAMACFFTSTIFQCTSCSFSLNSNNSKLTDETERLLVICFHRSQHLDFTYFDLM